MISWASEEAWSLSAAQEVAVVAWRWFLVVLVGVWVEKDGDVLGERRVGEGSIHCILCWLLALAVLASVKRDTSPSSFDVAMTVELAAPLEEDDVDVSPGVPPAAPLCIVSKRRKTIYDKERTLMRCLGSRS